MLGYEELSVTNVWGTPNVTHVNYINNDYIVGKDGEETFNTPADPTNYLAVPGVGSILNSINLHRNGPYGYPSWKQIRTGEHPVARSQKKQKIRKFPTFQH